MDQLSPDYRHLKIDIGQLLDHTFKGLLMSLSLFRLIRPADQCICFQCTDCTFKVGIAFTTADL